MCVPWVKSRAVEKEKAEGSVDRGPWTVERGPRSPEGEGKELKAKGSVDREVEKEKAKG
jgi:hypothetical protein